MQRRPYGLKGGDGNYGTYATYATYGSSGASCALVLRRADGLCYTNGIPSWQTPEMVYSSPFGAKLDP